MNAELMEYFNNKFAQMDQKFDRIESKLEQMDKRFEHCEERIGQSDSKIQKLTDDMENRIEDLRLDVGQDLKNQRSSYPQSYPERCGKKI